MSSKRGRVPLREEGEVRLTLRLDKKIKGELDLLYALDKKRSGGTVSWNSWVNSVLYNYCTGYRVEELERLKGLIREKVETV